MPLLTGNLDDITGTPLAAYSPRIRFQLSEPALNGSYLFPTKPVYAIPAPDGSFSINLIATVNMRPSAFYRMTVEWLDADGGYIGSDSLDWQLQLPDAGGNLGSLITTPWNPYLAWYGPDAPAGTPTAHTLWLDTDNGVLSIWS